MKKPLTKSLLISLLSLSLVAAGTLQTAHAAMIATETAIHSEQRAAQIARIESKLAREELRAQFVALGVAPEEVNARLGALTGSELVALEAQLDALPAGGSALAVIGIVFVVLLILELIGATNIFRNV